MMKTSILALHLGAIAMALGVAGCNRDRTESHNGVLQTKFPGQFTAGGGTSGQVLARTSRPVTDATYAGGTPGIAGGSGGTTSGAATAGTVSETGQGPSSGTTQPASAGRPGANLPPGDMNQGAPGSRAPSGSASGGEPATGVGQRTAPSEGAPPGAAAPGATAPAAGANAPAGSSAPVNVTPKTATPGHAGAAMGNTQTTTTPPPTQGPGAAR
jgi:hypothetical protein